MRVSSFVNPGKYNDMFPRLKGRGCEVKSLVEPLKQVWKIHKKNTAFDNKVSEALDALAAIQGIIDEYRGDAFFPDHIAKDFLNMTDTFLLAYSWLATECDKRALLLFNVVPKLHWMWHLAFRSRYLNPRRVATFIDEDFVKHRKLVASKSVAGPQMHRVPASLLMKYRWGMTLEGLTV